MRGWTRFGRRHSHLCRTLAVLSVILAPVGLALPAAASVQMQPDGALQIAGRSLRCGGIRNVLDPRLPNLGMASRRRNELILNPSRLHRYSSTVSLFVFHHECGHHHVGGDELEADCWAVHRGLRDGWLDRRHLASICGSFGNRRETDTHPAADERCASLYQCFTAASASRLEARMPLHPDTVAFTQAISPPRSASNSVGTDAPPLPIATLLLMFVALVLAAAPRSRRAEGTQ